MVAAFSMVASLLDVALSALLNIKHGNPNYRDVEHSVELVQ